MRAQEFRGLGQFPSSAWDVQLPHEGHGVVRFLGGLSAVQVGSHGYESALCVPVSLICDVLDETPPFLDYE